MRICIPKELYDTIEPIFKIKDSKERFNALSSYFDEDTANAINKRFESTKLSKNLETAQRKFINELTIDKATKERLLKDFDEEIARKKALRSELKDTGEIGFNYKNEIEDFANTIYKKKYNIDLTKEEIENVNKLSKLAQDTKKLPTDADGNYSSEYGVAMNALIKYTKELKNKGSRLKLFGKYGELAQKTEIYKSSVSKNINKTLLVADKYKHFASSGTFKSLKATLDASFVGVQGMGGLLQESPKSFKEGLSWALKAIKNPEETMDAFNSWLLSRKYYSMGEAGKLRLNLKEEYFENNLYGKIAGLKQLVNRADAMFTVFLQSARYNVFEKRIRQVENVLGRELNISSKEDLKLIKDTANFANMVTGTTSLGKADKYTPILNEITFAGRYLISDVKMITDVPVRFVDYLKLPTNTIEEVAFKKAQGKIAKMQAGYLLKTIGLSMGAYLGLSLVFPDNTEKNPTNPHFMMYKIGDRWYKHPLASKGLWLFKLTAKLCSSYEENSKGKKIYYGKGHEPKTKLDVVGKTAWGKLAPLPSLGVSILKGKTYNNQELTFLRALGSLFGPISLSDSTGELLNKDTSALDTGISIFLNLLGEQNYSTNSKLDDKTQLEQLIDEIKE